MKFYVLYYCFLQLLFFLSLRPKSWKRGNVDDRLWYSCERMKSGSSNDSRSNWQRRSLHLCAEYGYGDGWEASIREGEEKAIKRKRFLVSGFWFVYRKKLRIMITFENCLVYLKGPSKFNYFFAWWLTFSSESRIYVVDQNRITLHHHLTCCWCLCKKE